MRLNFSGSNEDEIREGIRRIGAVVAEQVALYETLTRRAPRGRSWSPAPRSPAADVLPMRRPRRDP